MALEPVDIPDDPEYAVSSGEWNELLTELEAAAPRVTRATIAHPPTAPRKGDIWIVET